MTVLTSVLVVSTSGASVVTLTVSVTPAGCACRSTGATWPTET